MTSSGSLPKTSPPETSYPFWALPASRLIEELQSDEAGLTSAEARRRLKRYGYNRLRAGPERSAFRLFLDQFKSPILLILFGAVGLSMFLRDRADALIILAIILVSGLLTYRQEKGARDTVRRLLTTVQVSVSVLRDGSAQDIPFAETVPGDVVLLAAGGIVPGDSLILDSKDLFVDEAALTGESFPVEKAPGLLPQDTPLARRTNTLMMGTHVVSGTAKALLVHTGKRTEFGRISEKLRLRPPETEFERGIRRFGYFLMEVTMVLLLIIFALNVFLAKPILDSFLFALALAVGLTPQLLPAIISINLAHGASRMAARRVVVKRLEAIENFGSMTVLCSDKTGTLTEGSVQLHSAEDIRGGQSEKILFLAACNAHFETGFANPLDLALLSHRPQDFSGYSKLDEIPYDFIRKRLSVLLSREGRSLLLTKGALTSVLDVCRTAETPEGSLLPLEAVRGDILQRYEALSAKGLRCVGLARREMGESRTVTVSDETEMSFLGLLSFVDPVKPGSAQAIAGLRDIGVQLKIITGDNALVAGEISRRVGVESPKIVTGPELRRLSDEALFQVAGRTDVFAEVEPNQKERLILALKKGGQVVGFLGDGINDAPALHAADVGISVDNAVDVAKAAADIVLLEKDLAVLQEGIREGRLTFANTLKYVFMATSANFGNMFSMAGASLFLPFLPLLPKQILLVNFLTDIPEMTIASDSVDPEIPLRPRRWDFGFIRNFMIIFGPLSSLFDFLTFAVLLLLLRADAALFRTGWFVESVVSASLIVLVVRTRRLFIRSRPGRALTLATLLVALVTVALPYTPLASLLGFTRLTWTFFPALGLVLGLYIASAEAAKYVFYRRIIRKEAS
jgi:Mg2+-importing ATPase